LSTHLNRRRSGIALGAACAALAGSVLFAAPAAAHTPRWSVDCDSVSVDLTYYSKKAPNTVLVTAGGKELVNKEFGASFSEELSLPEHSEPLTVTLTVDASDADRFDFKDTKTSPVCETPEPSEPPEPSQSPKPTPTTPPSEEPSPSEPPEPTAEPSTSEPAAEPEEDATAPPTDLAETGSSDSTPLIAGIAAAAVAAGGGLLVVARKRRSGSAKA
jgi:LPXTG-motif cell wall-anchored protein